MEGAMSDRDGEAAYELEHIVDEVLEPETKGGVS